MQIKQTKLIDKSPDNRIATIINNQNSISKTIVMPMCQVELEQLLKDIKKRLIPKTEWLNDVIIDTN